MPMELGAGKDLTRFGTASSEELGVIIVCGQR